MVENRVSKLMQYSKTQLGILNIIQLVPQNGIYKNCLGFPHPLGRNTAKLRRSSGAEVFYKFCRFCATKHVN